MPYRPPPFRCVSAISTALLATAVSAAARAESDAGVARVQTDDRPTAFDLGVVTEVPLMIGGQATLELPYGLLLQGEGGVMPAAYADAVGAVASAAGADRTIAAPLLGAGLSGAVVVGVSGGIRPARRLGLELLGGYTLIAAGGSADAGPAVEAATGLMLPPGAAAVSLHSTLHNVHASVGWRWLLGRHVSVRASIGYLQTVASSSHVEAPGVAAVDPTAAAVLANESRLIDRTLDGIYKTYVKSPLLSASVAYRF
jgi:hypothetical protein